MVGAPGLRRVRGGCVEGDDRTAATAARPPPEPFQDADPASPAGRGPAAAGHRPGPGGFEVRDHGGPRTGPEVDQRLVPLVFDVLDDAAEGGLAGPGLAGRGDPDRLRAPPHDDPPALLDPEQLVVGAEVFGQGEPLPAEADRHPALQRGVHDGLEEVDARGADEGGHEHVVRQGVDLAGRTDLLEDSAAHHGHPAAQGHRLGLIMRDVDRGDAQFLARRSRPQFSPTWRREIARVMRVRPEEVVASRWGAAVWGSRPTGRGVGMTRAKVGAYGSGGAGSAGVLGPVPCDRRHGPVAGGGVLRYGRGHRVLRGAGGLRARGRR